jgi:hypothetical protein
MLDKTKEVVAKLEAFKQETEELKSRLENAESELYNMVLPSGRYAEGGIA